MGDIGARMLAKALQINTYLQVVHWDKNNTTPQGLTDVASALEKYVHAVTHFSSHTKYHSIPAWDILYTCTSVSHKYPLL